MRSFSYNYKKYGHLTKEELGMLFITAVEAEVIHFLDHITQAVAALELVFNLAKNLTNFIFDGVGVACTLAEAFQVGE